jgi:hypothetical protein
MASTARSSWPCRSRLPWSNRSCSTNPARQLAFIDMLQGRDIGKQLVKLTDE